jgi:hypothetical protein
MTQHASCRIMKYPWFKFYPTDWRADPLLRRCSLAARGLWIELVAVMHESAEYGHLDPSLTERDIALLVGAPLKTVRSALAELEMNRVFDRGEKGEIVSRRMVRDHAKALKDRENGKKGGHPGIKHGVNPEVHPEGSPQIPEARIQNDGDGERTAAKPLIGSPPSISETAFKLTGNIAKLCGRSGDVIPPNWAGAPIRVQSWLNQGWKPEQIEASCREQMVKRRGEPPTSITYFEPGIAQFVARVSAPVPTVTLQPARTYVRQLTPYQQRLDEHRAALERFRRERGIKRKAHESDERAAGDHDHPDHPEPL